MDIVKAIYNWIIDNPVPFYLIGVNLFAFILMGIDKGKAKVNVLLYGARVPEPVLWLFSLLGGFVGIFGGMLVFKHKTKKFWFQLCSFLAAVPSIILLLLIVLLYFFTD